MSDFLGPDFNDDHLRAALQALSREPDLADAVVRHRARARRRNRRLTAAAAVLALGTGTFAVVAITDSNDEVPIATDSTDAATTSSALAEPSGAHLVFSPRMLEPGFATEVSAALVNDSDEVVAVCASEDQVLVDGSRLVYPVRHGPACADLTNEFVLPGQFSHEWTIDVPALDEGTYTFESGETLQVTAFGPAGPGTAAQHTINFAGADQLQDPTLILPDEVVVLGGNRLAIRWTSACNQPGYDVTLDYEGSAWGWSSVEVQLRTGHFVTTDCLGEPSNWSTVIDLPEPLLGADVWAGSEGGPGIEPVSVPVRRVDVWPMGEPLPALATMDREPLSILAPSGAAPGWISLRPYDGCGAWIARPISDDNAMYLQAYVPADNETCDNGPTPTLGFSVDENTTYDVFGWVKCAGDPLCPY
jgi:hypothetical protein